MVTKSLISLIDEAVVPAVLLIVTKMLSLLVISHFLHYSFILEPGKILFLLPAISFSDPNQFQIVSIYSNFTMFAFAALGTVIVILRANFLHQSHINPKLHSKLVSLNLENLVLPSYHLYHQSVIWLTYLWLTVAIVTISQITSVSSPALSVFAFIIAANLSWIFALDVEREIDIAKSE